MAGLQDLKLNLFTAFSTTTGFQYSSGVQVRAFFGNSESIEGVRVSLLGSVTLGPAALVTFVVESSSDGTTGTFKPVGIFDTPTVAAGVGTSPLLDFRFTRATDGVMPAASFEPDGAYIRVGVKSDVAGALVTMDAYVHQTQESQ